MNPNGVLASFHGSGAGHDPAKSSDPTGAGIGVVLGAGHGPAATGIAAAGQGAPAGGAAAAAAAAGGTGPMEAPAEDFTFTDSDEIGGAATDSKMPKSSRRSPFTSFSSMIRKTSKPPTTGSSPRILRSTTSPGVKTSRVSSRSPPPSAPRPKLTEHLVTVPANDSVEARLAALEGQQRNDHGCLGETKAAILDIASMVEHERVRQDRHHSPPSANPPSL